MTAADPLKQPDFLAGTGEMGSLIRGFDWTKTPLGPIESWPHSLKTSVSLILGSRHPMWIGWGREMTFLYNDAYLHVLGPAKHPSALGMYASDVWSEIWDVCGPLADKVFELGEASFMDDVRLFMDRGGVLEETFYSFSYSPIRDDSGSVCGLFCPSTDVTPKVLNARRLATLSELSANALGERTVSAACATFAHTLSKNSDDIPFALLYLADNGGRAVLAEAVGEFPAGFPSLAAVDLECDDLTPWPVSEVYREAQRQIVHVGHVATLPRGVAAQRVTHAVVLPVMSRGESEPYGVLVVGANPCRLLDAEYQTFFELIAGQVATAIQNARAMAEEKKRADLLAEIDHAKTVFFSNVSHEFRTPLALMLGPLESLLAKDHTMSAEDHEELVIAHRNSLRLLKLVNSLLDFSRLEAGRLKASFVPTDLASFTSDLASNFRSAMHAAGLELIVDCPPLAELVYVDREMWEKVVLNLLSNAFKFTFQGGITVRLHASGGQANLTVSDTGIGIPEAELPRIFDRFHRVEGARGRTYEGTGIGLALIQEYVRLHGGSIAASSRLGEGSTFTVSLPLGIAHLPADRIVHSPEPAETRADRARAFTGEAVTWLTGTERPSAVSRMERATGTVPRIVLADDNADMRDHVSRILGADYDVRIARDSQEALEMIRRDLPDLLLSDIMMPRMDGLELLRAVRAGERTQTLPIIFLSARAGEEMRVEGIVAGADDYIVKPFTAGELRARVGTHVRMSIARKMATERESALRAEAEAARDQAIAVLESITDGFVALDRDWRITYVNREAELLTGRRREQLLGRMCWELFSAAGEATPHAELVRAAGQRVAVEFELQPGVGEAWWHIKAYPAADGGISVFYEDITSRKAAEEALRQSEERFRGVFESSAVGVAILTLDARFLQTNRAFSEITGYSSEELRSFSCPELTHPDDRQAMFDLLGKLISAEIPTFVQEKRYSTKDGRSIWVNNSVSAMRDVAGNPEYLIALCEDITARREAELALAESEARFRQLADSMPQIVWTGRPDGQLDYYNERWYEFTGSDRGRFGENSWKQFLHPEDVQRTSDAWYGSVREGRPYRAELRLWDKSESRWRWFMGRALAVRDSDGRIVKWFGTATDIDEQKRVEDELRRANQDLEQFAYTASHDLQEPLRSIKIYGELLTRRYNDRLNGEALEFLDFLRTGASRMEMLVRDLLAYTQVTRVEAPTESVDANEAFRGVLGNLSGAIAESGARVTSEPLPALPVHGLHLRQLFQNLLSNAIKYRNPDRLPDVHVSSRRQDGGWIFSVRDNGIGIEPEYKEHIFGLFKRLHTSDEYSGTGIGLAICQRIVERYHGRIWVESEPGQGSTFYFVLSG